MSFAVTTTPDIREKRPAILSTATTVAEIEAMTAAAATGHEAAAAETAVVTTATGAAVEAGEILGTY